VLGAQLSRILRRVLPSAGNERREMNYMNVKTFVDTNILIYAHDLDAGPKHQCAADVIRTLWETGVGVISTQVLQEFYVNVTQKIPHPLSYSG
jgi:predicted nucleic acid-binding protein